MSVFNIRPAVLTDSTREFVVPPTILSDYKNYLYSDKPHTVYDFQILKNWYDKFKDIERVYIRAEYTPINWKSKVGNSDLNKNFRTDYDVKINKGDLCIREDGLIVMLNWQIQEEPNAQATQAIECNHMVTIKRSYDAVADKRGYKLFDAHDEIIVDSMPCIMSEYAGRPDFSAAQNTPGISADMLMICQLQFNEYTNSVRIGDTFEYDSFTYRIVNRVSVEVDISKTYGVIRFEARRVAGEDV